jgi:hypothetical protein
MAGVGDIDSIPEKPLEKGYRRIWFQFAEEQTGTAIGRTLFLNKKQSDIAALSTLDMAT